MNNILRAVFSRDLRKREDVLNPIELLKYSQPTFNQTKPNCQT